MITDRAVIGSSLALGLVLEANLDEGATVGVRPLFDLVTTEDAAPVDPRFGTAASPPSLRVLYT